MSINILLRKSFLVGPWQKRKWLLILFSFFYFPVFAAGLEPSAPALTQVKQMLRSMKMENYRQTFIYENQSGIATVKLSHAFLDGHEYERLVFISGPAQEFIRKDNDIIALKGDLVAHPVLNSFNLFPLTLANEMSLSQLEAFYYFKNQGTERIANRECVKLSILPKDRFRYGYMIWIDKKTGVMLRTDLLNENLSPLDRFLVTDFRPNAGLIAKDFTSDDIAWKKSDIPVNENNQKESASSNFPWKPDWLPAGFVANAYTITKSPVNGGKVNHAFYSDGLSAFSVYIEKDTSRVLNQSAERYGATSAVSRVFKTGKNAYYNVTVIGELPLGAAERVATSIQKKEASVD